MNRRLISAVFLNILIIYFLIPHYSFSQKGNETVILLQGKVTDAQTGQPVSTLIQFVSSKGKKMQTKTNSNDGGYQQVMPPNDTYTVLAKGYSVVGGSNILPLPNPADYMEMTKNFTVRKLTVGTELARFNAFAANSSEIRDFQSPQLNEIKDLLSFNSNINIYVTVHTHDSYFKPDKKQIKDETPVTKSKSKSKPKAKTKTITITTEEQLTRLANQRIEALKLYFRNLKLPEKAATYTADTHPAAATEKIKAAPKKIKGKKSKDVDTPAVQSAPANVVITIGKIMNM